MTTNRVYLLGAGFSRAISPYMPIMNELSQMVRDELRANELPVLPGEGTPLASNFEQWLSYLIDSPPWLSEGQRLRNQGAFSDVSDAVFNAIGGRQNQAMNHTACPLWLSQLVGYWESTHASVITFNYDILIEVAWRISTPSRDLSWMKLYPVPVTPIAARQGAVLGGESPPGGMRLLKLHGSLNWRYSGPGSPPGDTVYDVGVKGTSWSLEGISPVYTDWERLAADRIPMIVPPAAVKSPYYGNQTIQSLWKQAARAIGAADELVIMGFSLPQSDLIVSSLISTELAPHATVVPVDFGSDVVPRVRQVIDPDNQQPDRIVEQFAGLGADAIPTWVEVYASAPD